MPAHRAASGAPSIALCLALLACQGAGPSDPCADRGVECGAVTGPGGELVECGECAAPETCGGAGEANRCGGGEACSPATCEELGAVCGEVPDGCGGTLRCGDPCTPFAPSEPVVLEGSRFEGLEGVGTEEVRIYRFDGAGFRQVASQVDERVDRTLDVPLGSFALHSPETSYVFDTWGPLGGVRDDRLAGLVDGDDEVVFLAGDAGERAPGDAWVEGADDRRWEIALADPLGSGEGFVYLFAHEGGGAPEPLEPQVLYTPEGVGGARIQTPVYELAYAGRWSLDELRVGGGEDLIDRFKGRAFDLVEGETEVLWDQWSLLLGVRSGPVRTVREVVGAASGVTTTYTAELYADRARITTHLRVHEITDVWQYVDLDSRRGEMTYRDDVVDEPVAIDGVPEELSAEPRAFTEVSSSAGSLVQLFEVLDVSPLLNGADRDLEFFYADSSRGVGPGLDDLTGDDQPAAWGAHGVHVLRLCIPLEGGTSPCEGNDPAVRPCCDWTDPSGEIINTGSYFHPLTFRLTLIPIPAGAPADGAALRERLDAPLRADVRVQDRDGES